MLNDDNLWPSPKSGSTGLRRWPDLSGARGASTRSGLIRRGSRFYIKVRVRDLDWRSVAEVVMKFLRVKEIQKMTTLSRSTIWKLERDGKFPKGRSLPALPAAKVWLESEVQAWMQLEWMQQSASLHPSDVRSNAA